MARAMTLCGTALAGDLGARRGGARRLVAHGHVLIGERERGVLAGVERDEYGRAFADALSKLPPRITLVGSAVPELESSSMPG